MGTKIQINSLPALERLLGSDPDFEVEFRRSVLAEYEKKHILPSIKGRVEAIINATASEQLGFLTGGGTFSLRHEAVIAIREIVRERYRDCLAETVRAEVQSAVNAASENFAQHVEEFCKNEVTKKIRDAIKSRLESTLQRELGDPE